MRAKWAKPISPFAIADELWSRLASCRPTQMRSPAAPPLMWQLALIQAMGLSKPCQSYSSVWANCAARIENSSSSWLIFNRRRISSAAISSPALGATPPTPLCILRLYEQMFGESIKRGVNFARHELPRAYGLRTRAYTLFKVLCSALRRRLDRQATRHHADFDAAAVD